MAKFFSHPTNPPVVIIGLGRFGMALGEELVQSGVEVLGIDVDEAVVAKAAPLLTHAVIAETTDQDVLRQLGVQDAHRVVIGIGSDMGASLLTASAVMDLGVPNVWAKADNQQHAKILTQIGVHHVGAARARYGTARGAPYRRSRAGIHRVRPRLRHGEAGASAAHARAEGGGNPAGDRDRSGALRGGALLHTTSGVRDPLWRPGDCSGAD